MNANSLRYQAVKSLKLAIDLDHEDKAVEAYLKYLEGLSLVVTVLQKDAINGGKWVITDKDRRSMVNFAKESIERITLLLKRQDKIAEKKDAKEESTVTHPASQRGTNALSPMSSPTEAVSSSINEGQNEAAQSEYGFPVFSGPTSNERNQSITSRPPEDNVLFVDTPLSPLDAVRLENNQLSKKYAQRLLNVPLSQKPQLRLELERRIAENMAIAETRQQVWEAERERAIQHFRHIAEQKCKQHQTSKNDPQGSVDPGLQEAIYSCYIFEWERKLRSIDSTLEVYPKPVKVSSPESTRRSLRRSIDLVTRALRGSIRGHPLGSLLVQKQQSVCRQINKLLTSHDFAGETSVEPSTFLVNLGNEEAGALCIFNKIAEGIKSDIEFLEKTILSLYEPLGTVDGHQLLSQTLQKIYFPAITPSIKELLRLCVSSLRVTPLNGRENADDVKGGACNRCTSPSMSALNSSEVESRFRLQSLQSLSSPCEKLDCLMEVMRSLCSWKFGCPANVDRETVQPIGADDLLSRLVAVIHGGEENSQRNLVKLLQMEAVFLQAFLPDDMVLGEAGYCVTVLCSVLAI